MSPKAPTILVVDDNADLAALVRSILEERNYQVVTAANGVEALEVLKTVRPDLIVLDISMPRMDGLEFFKQIRTKFGRARYPVLVLTGEVRLEETFSEVDADGFIAKPFEVRDFTAKVSGILEKASQPVAVLMDFKGNPHSAVIAEELEAERHKTVTVPALSALKEALRSGAHPRCVLVEYLRPETNGDEFIREVRDVLDAGGAADAAIVAYTYSGLDYRDKSLKAGAALFIARPQEKGSFVKALRSIWSGAAAGI